DAGDARLAGEEGEQRRAVGRRHEGEALFEEAREALEVLGAVFAYDPDRPRRAHAGKHAPTPFFHGALSARTMRCPRHSCTRSRRIASPRPLSRRSRASSVSSLRAESPTRSTSTRRPVASRSSPTRTSTLPLPASLATAAWALRKRF